MNTNLDWLNQYLDRPTDAEEAERVLTDAGFPLDDETKTDDGHIFYDFEVTSNRPDCLSHIGLAREVAASTGRSLQLPDENLEETDGTQASDQTSVTNDATDLCPLYTARVIQGVKIGPSPKWLADRLASIGLRPVNNVVDITNFVLFETGQPLHAFDMDRLSENRIVVRRAKSGEPFTAIDGTKHKLTDTMLVIADAEHPVALAGVMGGLDSEVSEQTTNILLESALFEPLNVRSTSRALKLSSDSSYRFERGVDPTGIDRASRRAAQLIVELAGGTLHSGTVVAGDLPSESKPQVTLRADRCRSHLGIDIATERMTELLAALELAPQAEGELISCTIPPHRADLTREVDLIEEVARLHGYDQIGMDEKMRLEIKPPQRSVLARKTAGDVLIAHGYHETITFTFAQPDQAKPFLAAGHQLVCVDEEKKKAEPALRPSLLPSLLNCRKGNQDAGNTDVRLFEIAAVFSSDTQGFVEHRRLGLLCDAEDKATALRQMRGTLEELALTLGVTLEVQPTQSNLGWSDESGTVQCNGVPAGHYGLANEVILKRFGLQTSVVLAEIDYPSLTEAYPPDPNLHDLPRFPAIDRDLSIIVNESTAWSSIQSVIDKAHPQLLESTDFVTIYRGKPIPKGRKSVTLRMRFRDPNRTLKHEEVSQQVDDVVKALAHELQAELRD